MYEKFTDRARKVMQLANEEAQQLSHEYIGTEHILLGLVKEGSGVAANVLKNLDIDLRTIRLEVEKLIKPGPPTRTFEKLPQTPRGKRVIEYALEEAGDLGHNYVGSEHILLGLLREREGVAAWVLENLGVTLAEVREEVLSLHGQAMDRGDKVSLPSCGQRAEQPAEKVEEPPAACPICGNPRLVRVLWNRVELDGSEAKEVVAGHAILASGFTGNVPSWGCLSCEPRWSEVHRLALQNYQWQVAKADAVASGEFEAAARICDAQEELRPQLAALLTQLLLR
jgi:hypothetical protein